jgi:thiamine phosphate synthase YjbQ (UPF0047 family)
VTSVEIPYSVACALPSLVVIDITNDVAHELQGNEHAADGIAYVTAVEDSSLVRVNERESGFFVDLEQFLARLVPLDRADRARMLTLMCGPRTEQIPVQDGQLCLGSYQRLLLFGFEGASNAEWSLTVVG